MVTAPTSIGGGITFNGTVDGARNLTAIANTTNGTVTYGGLVGSNTALSNLSTTAKTINVTATTPTKGNTVLTTANQTYSGAVTTSTNLVLNAGGVFTLASGSTITNSGTGSGNNIIIVGNRILNNAGSAALVVGGSAGTNYWQVWSRNANPFNTVANGGDNTNGLVNNYVQYDATYPSTIVQGTGNGFLYSLKAPIAVTLSGTISKLYDGNANAVIPGANYSPQSGSISAVQGALNGDVVTLTNSLTGTYSQSNVGSNLVVTPTADPSISAKTSVANGSKSVYGYAVNFTNTLKGTINPATVTVDISATKVYDGTVNYTLSMAPLQVLVVIPLISPIPYLMLVHTLLLALLQ